MSKIPIFLLLVLLIEKNIIFIKSLSVNSNCDVISFTRNFTKISNELLSSDAFLNSDFETRIRIISEKMRYSYEKLSEISSSNLAEIVNTFQRSFPQKGQLEEAFSQFYGYVERIDALHKHYKHYKISDQLTGFESPYHSSTLNDFFQVLGSHGTGGTQDILDKIYHIMVPSASDSIRLGIFQLMSEQRKASHPRNLCDTENSFFHQLNELYDILFHIETMAYVAMAYSFMLFGKKDKTSYKTEIQKIALAFARRIIKYLNVVQKEMKVASREIYRCDPPHHILNETFIEFSHLFQKILINEVQITPSKTCSTSCGQINANKINRCYTWKSSSKSNIYCPKRYCRGIMRNCSWVGTSTVCEFPSESPRRYQWISSENGQYGPRERCLGTELRVEQTMSGLYRCDNCLCQCVEERADATSLRAISLRPQFSDYSNNMVVTGVRLVEKDKLIHIQIQQGQLIKDGQINRSTTEWVELEDFEYDESKNGFYKVGENGSSPLEEGIDYAFIGSKINKLFIDDVTGPVETLVTGVRFNHSFPQWPGELNTSPIEIEIYISHFLYESGKLNSGTFESIWVTSKNMPNPPASYSRDRKVIKLKMPDNPTRSYENYPNTDSNYVIVFRQTDIWKDAGQTTIPLFDLQPVVSPIRPLDGIGIIHRNDDGNGGFISLKIFTVNCTLHLRVIDRADTLLHKTALNDQFIEQILKFYEKKYLD